MHGKGTLYLNSGEKIETKWDHGLKSGPGVITDSKGKKKKVTFFKDL